MDASSRTATAASGKRFGRGHPLGVVLFLAVLSGALYYTGQNLLGDIGVA